MSTQDTKKRPYFIIKTTEGKPFVYYSYARNETSAHQSLRAYLSSKLTICSSKRRAKIAMHLKQEGLYAGAYPRYSVMHALIMNSIKTKWVSRLSTEHLTLTEYRAMVRKKIINDLDYLVLNIR